MNGWTLLALAFALIAGIFCAMTLWLWIDYRVIKRVAKRVQAENDNLVAQNADLYEALQETIAECDSLALQLEQATRTKPLPARKPRAKKTEAQP